MRPLRLEMTAFGPFSEVETIDFSRIEDQALLLIQGPTGAGKTTILDAICFALFGDSSGAERDPRQMRCSHADPDSVTRVQFDFELGGRRYRAIRQPEQDRPKLRGEGQTTEPHKAQLWDRTEVTGEDGEGAILATGPKKVTERVEELFGFELSQFRQVVMLPQGQFRRFLNAESKEKERILERLFQTHVYAAISDRLGDRASDLQQRTNVLESKQRGMLEGAAVKSFTDLEQRRSQLSVELEEAERSLTELRAAAQAAARALHGARLTQARLDELEAARGAHASLEEREPEIETLRQKREAARRAAPLVGLKAALARQGLETDRVRFELTRAREDEAKARTAKEQAEARWERQSSIESGRDQLLEEQRRVEDLRDVVTEWLSLKSSLAQKSGDAEKLEREYALSVEKLNRTGLELEKRRKEISELEAIKAQAGKHELGLAYHERLLETRKRFADAEQEQIGAAKDLAAVRQRAREAADLVEHRRDALESLERHAEHGVAGRLARDLVDGAPCPVCGSMEHPEPAKTPADLPEPETIAAAREELDQAAHARVTLQREEDKSKARVEMATSRLEDLQRDLGSELNRPIDALTALVAQERAALEASLAADARAVALEEILERLSEQIAALESRVTLTRQMASEGREDARVATRLTEQATSKIPSELRSLDAVQHKLETLEARRAELERSIVEAQQLLSESAEKFAAADAKRRALEAALDETSRIEGEARAELAQKRSEAGLEDDNEFKAAIELAPELEQLEGELAEYRSALRSVTDRLARAEEAARGSSAPDLEALERENTDAETKLEAAQRTAARASRELESLTAVSERFTAAQREASALEREHREVAQIARAARGVAPYNISFQRFVLAALLDDVLIAASSRLHRMSRGRYRLERSDEVRHRGRAAGLELSVMDAYTGTLRPVETLSGGEGFWAALSLSLGLADVVQAYAGGIKLDAMFIDEGFGTLDPDSLDLALDTLTELNAEGRLVAIISHVPELRARISTRLEVLPSDRGSKTQLHLG